MTKNNIEPQGKDFYTYYLANRLIKNFREEFKSKVGFYPDINYTHINKLSLSSLKKVVEGHIPKEDLEKYGGIATNTRRWCIVPYRMVFVVIAVSMGYGLAEIARYINRDHSSVIYLRDKYKELCPSQPRLIQIFNKVNQSTYDTSLIRSSDQAKDYPEPVPRFMVPKSAYSAAA